MMMALAAQAARAAAMDRILLVAQIARVLIATTTQARTPTALDQTAIHRTVTHLPTLTPPIQSLSSLGLIQRRMAMTKSSHAKRRCCDGSSLQSRQQSVKRKKRSWMINPRRTKQRRDPKEIEHPKQK